MIKVLMVNPRFTPSFWDFKIAVEMLGLRATMPPTGLATLAAMLPYPGFHVLPIIDLNVERLTNKMIKQADMVMITAMLPQEESLRQVIAQAKRFGKTVVVGGPYATYYRDEVLAMGADCVVLGEAEMTLPKFITDCLAGRMARVYDEESVRSCSPVSLNDEYKPDITGTPIPRWDLLKLRYYSSVGVQFSRGCPFKCEFCNIWTLLGHAPRTKTPKQFIDELEAIRVTGWRGSVFVVDDNFIGNRKAVRELLVELIKWQKKHHFPFTFFTEASVDLANGNMREIRELMVEAGFQEIFVGIESTDPEVLAEMHKAQNRGDLAEKVRILQASGLKVMAGFIIGNDLDPANVCERLFEFIQRTGIVTPMVGLLTALRGTKLYERLKEEGRLRGDPKGSNTHWFKLNFVPKLDEAALIASYVKLLEDLFSSRNYFDRCRTLRARCGKHRCHSRLNRGGILATMRIFYRNIFQHFDWEFIKYMMETICTSPRELPEAIAESVKGAHFQELTWASVAAYRQSA